MTEISISFEKNNKGKFDFEVVQNGEILYSKEYAASTRDKTGLTQEQVFSGYVEYLQDLVNEELSNNPDFKWNSIYDFKKFAGAKTFHMFMNVEDKYISRPKAG